MDVTRENRTLEVASATCHFGTIFDIIQTSMPKNGMDAAENRDRKQTKKKQINGNS